MLRLTNVEAGYGALRVLKGISLHVSQGEIVAIIGANGAGKTTLLKSIAGILQPRSGTILFDKQDLRGLPPDRIVQLGCSMVPEGRHVFPTMTVKENLILGAYSCRGKGQTREAVKASMDEVCRLFDILKEREHQLAGTLSGGQQQMLAIARALMSKPRLLMMDEPSLGVAPLVVRDIYRTITTLKRDGLTILLVEQNARAALAVADRGYVIETGQIVLEGTSRELSDNREVQRAYLGKEYERIDE
ncbi:MAG TPA: ABC transporter ATP-binding protein [Phycisphaerae bacterium]|jgi:branched-chain amino acid transport system ATP-binding protein|nr:ABC transporter ATP-binding protein [Phycisphaerae bacterium]HRR83515.1 ABC transporter ATP-binding protein [Phycisphaerae bacterium]